ncbi:MAG TPA: carbamoyltransferase N-terminal domain-containing protein, partial [Planctomycetota bacterium]|nr:carbamoyltransferase N-terminal domain-containing protein [Planctomycetota bacterium]
MRILGLSAFGGESAAALLVDGVPVAAASEERFSGLRRDPAFPRRAVRFCLRQAATDAAGLDWVVFHSKPLRVFERVLLSQLRGFPDGARSFSRSMFLWLGDRLWIKERIADELGLPSGKVLFVEHHRAHAAAAFLPSPFERAAILVATGAAEWPATSLHAGEGSRIEPLDEVRFPHSLCLFLAALAEHLGFP